MKKCKIGVISDTHGLLRKDVLNIFKNCKLIIHAGDIGNIEIIKELESIAPVVAVKGNCDRDVWAKKIQANEMIEVEGVNIYILHNIQELNLDPYAAEIDVIISGHSHNPSKVIKNGVLFLNPGSAGPKRFSLPISASVITIINKEINAEIINF